ncbi:RNA polymerase sigma factor [Chryseolinea sp. T2]|uniref:RNA polymerase sigma factor n=1 Tax=Chryseolinea sp. T2 TaxID=3129255 RepID=UPI0030781520
MNEEERKRIFQGWLEHHRGLIFKIVRAYTQTIMDREDLFQEIAVQLWKSISSFRGESKETTWIYRVAINTSIRWLRAEKRRTKVDMRDVQLVLHETESAADQQLAWLYDEIAKLDDVDRSLALMLLEDFSYKEMSVVLGISESNVGVRIHRIKKQLMSKSGKVDRYEV